MLNVEYSEYAAEQINDIYTNDGIYDKYGHFTQQFVNWNGEFHRYISIAQISKYVLSSQGFYTIGTIGMLVYNYFTINDTEIFEIIEFRFTKLPYQSTNKYRVIGNAGYGYKIVQSTFNNLYAILTPQNRLLTKYAFDGIIGFHHSSNAFNAIYAIGFIGDRTYTIYTNGNINLLPYSKEEYLKMKHKYYESRRFKSALINENKIRRIVTDVINNILYIR